MTNEEIALVRQDLTKLVRGLVLDSADVGYAETVLIDNGRISLRPFLVAVPLDAEDVASVLKYCNQKGIPLTTKAGGHSAAGYCLNDSGVVLDLSNLNTIEFINKGSGLRLGGGVRWIRAYNFLRDRQSNYNVIGGGCAGVGVAGFILGGGYSFISRSYGLGSDNVVGMQFVTVDGDIKELNEKSVDQEGELYWALRGAGGGNFGVVTRIDLQMHKTPTYRQTMGQIDFPFYRINDVLNFYNGWAHTLPNEMAVYGMLRSFPDRRFGGKPLLTLRFTPIFNGPMEEADRILSPLTKMMPTSKELYSMTLPEWENFVGTSTQVKGHSAYIRSLVLSKQSLTNEVAEICKKHMSRAPSPDSFVVWTHTGGRIREIDTDSSYAHRDCEYTFEVKSEWNSSQPMLTRPNVEWAVNYFDELEKHAEGAYLNYIDPLQLNWQKSYYRDKYARLLRVRQHWDPNGKFEFQQGIGSNYQTPDRTTPLDLSPLSRTICSVKKGLQA